MVNSTGRIVLANSHAEQLFGYGEGQLRARPIETLLASAAFAGGHVGHRAGFVAQSARARDGRRSGAVRVAARTAANFRSKSA